MRPLALRTVFVFLLAGSAQAGPVEAPVSVEFSPGGPSGAIGSSFGTPSPIQFTVPTLTGASAPNLNSALAPAPNPLRATAVQPVAAVAAVQPVPALPASIMAPAASDRSLERNNTLAALRPENASRPESSLETDPGRVLFDQSAARTGEPAVSGGGLWVKVKNLLSLGEAVPSWPGKSGDVVRVGGIKTALDQPAGDGGTAKVWKSRNGRFAIKILHPGARNAPGVSEEAATLRAISGTDLPVAKLLAESRDGSVLVKEFIEGDTAHKILERGGFSRSQSEGWPELAAKLIGAGVTADLARGNLVWQHWRTRWVIVDGGSLTAGSSRATLDQLLAPDLLSRAGLDPVKFLSGLRARLGPDSAAWTKTRAELRSSKVTAPQLAALERLDASEPAGPALAFGPAPKGPSALNDTVVSGSEVKKRVGYDPLQAKSKSKLHGDDPGKLNTTILAVAEPGKTPYVVKIAQWDIIRNEVAARRLARRFFGRYVRVPASLAVENGYESYMVMEKLAASPSHYKNAFTLEQRVAMALFIRTFGIGDVNPGNVLAAHDNGLPWLIDFEQAFSRVTPVAGRIPDERIALEMPWMSLFERNRIEDYQPGARAWRAFLAEPETRAGILEDLTASGFKPAEAAAMLSRFDLNAADLDWTLQNDADFVNQFVDRKAAQR